MASTLTRHKDTSAGDSIPTFPAPPNRVTMNLTPERTPEKKVMGITQAQKQALIDNLQLEITERARRLRAQYATQAAQLRSRLEMRVNRIPQALRKRKLQDLIDEHAAKAKPAPPPAPRVTTTKTMLPPPIRAAVTKLKQAAKRKSDEISGSDDKENMPSSTSEEIANPKKRVRAAPAAANSKVSRTISRKGGPTAVLSPKSHNSRTLPKSPFKPAGGSPEKPQMSRPTSAASRGKSKVERGPSRQVKRPDTSTDTEGRTSGASNTSAGTTIIRRPATKKTATAKKAVPTKAAPVAKKIATTTRKENVAPAATASGRTLRKRN